MGPFFLKGQRIFFLEIIIQQDLKNVVNHCFCLSKQNRIPQGTKSMVHPDGTRVSVFLTTLKISQEK